MESNNFDPLRNDPRFQKLSEELRNEKQLLRGAEAAFPSA